MAGNPPNFVHLSGSSRRSPCRAAPLGEPGDHGLADYVVHRQVRGVGRAHYHAGRVGGLIPLSLSVSGRAPDTPSSVSRRTAPRAWLIGRGEVTAAARVTASSTRVTARSALPPSVSASARKRR